MPATSTAHAFSDDALGRDDAVGIARRLANGECSPEEVRDAAIARCNQVDGYLHAIATECFDPPLKTRQADHSQPEQAFAGVPTFIKDNAPVAGLPTGYGSASINARAEKRHGPYTRQFLSLGFEVLGKSSLPEFGFNATTEPAHAPATCNPWNLEFSSGASSGGSAALVAAGAVPIAHGNDGGGSIRIPAACCGLVGLKPSRGRHVNSTQARALPINIVSEGVLSRSVRDTAYFHYYAQRHFRNHRLPELPLIQHPGKRRLRIGYYADSVGGFSTDRDTRDALERTLEKLESLGHHLEEIRFPVHASFGEDFSLYWGMMAFLVKHTGKASIAPSFQASRLDDLSIGLAKHYQQQMLKTPGMLYRLKRHGQDYNQHFEHYDLLLSPVLSQSVRPLGELHPSVDYDELFERLMRYVGFTPMANVSGAPSLSLPMGRCQSGLPIGMLFTAGPGQEQTLLKLAYEIEGAYPWPLLADIKPGRD